MARNPPFNSIKINPCHDNRKWAAGRVRIIKENALLITLIAQPVIKIFSLDAQYFTSPLLPDGT
jgi:hypothetical protein